MRIRILVPLLCLALVATGVVGCKKGDQGGLDAAKATAASGPDCGSNSSACGG